MVNTGQRRNIDGYVDSGHKRWGRMIGYRRGAGAACCVLATGVAGLFVFDVG